VLAVHCWSGRLRRRRCRGVYADDRGAVLITHDREFTRRRMKNTIGRHVRLDCEQPDAMAVIGAHLDALVAALERVHDVVIVVSAAGVARHAGQWE
jgi:hypothetical protein